MSTTDRLTTSTEAGLHPVGSAGFVGAGFRGGTWPNLHCITP